MQHVQPKAITIHHLRRRAIVYRRSTVCSPAFLNRQIAQRDVAIKWGWRVDAIEVISDDVMSSSLDANRPGYQRLLRMIKDEQVGLVLVSDLARLSRSPVEFERLLDLCRSTDTLLAANGVILPRDVHNQRYDQLLQICCSANKPNDYPTYPQR